MRAHQRALGLRAGILHHRARDDVGVAGGEDLAGEGVCRRRRDPLAPNIYI